MGDRYGMSVVGLRVAASGPRRVCAGQVQWGGAWVAATGGGAKGCISVAGAKDLPE